MWNRFSRSVSLTALSLTMTGCVANFAPLETVDAVDLERYAGKWYEIASYAAPFQRGCTGTTAEYTLSDDGTVGVLNTCMQDSLDGPERTATGQARAVEGSNNAKLLVRFFIFSGDYWILDLGDADDYGYAVVGAPNRDLLWVLSRTPTMDQELYEGILQGLPDKGFDPDRLQLTPQPETP